jgi:hypothetical protein
MVAGAPGHRSRATDVLPAWLYDLPAVRAYPSRHHLSRGQVVNGEPAAPIDCN